MKISRVLKIAFLKRKSKLPTSLILLITSRCNARCSFCIFKDSINRFEDELSLKDYNQLSDSLGKMFRMHISGGEPFLRADLPKICEIFSKKNQVDEIALPTNGLMPEKISSLTDDILKRCPNTHIMISLSLDGPKELHDQLRGVAGCFDKALETYHKLIELKKSHSDLRVHVTTTITKYNYDYLKDFIEFVKKEMPDLNSHNFEFVREKPDEICKDLPTIAQCQEFERLHQQVVKDTRNHFKSKFKSKLANIVKNYKFHLLIEILKQRCQLIPCDAGQSIGVVDWRGDVYLCELLSKVGNIKQNGFKGAWYSEVAQKQRQFIKAGKCFCTHGCFQGANILFQPKNYFKILKYWIFKK